ncbi:transcriptional regulator ATRX homolog [Halyomorpha halys]|uniref:transcriptional regulator ATRX homolog n=1 Tax=Halyomorpha halys TaxID=286706 RepID=UPI0034D37CD6
MDSFIRTVLFICLFKICQCESNSIYRQLRKRKEPRTVHPNKPFGERKYSPQCDHEIVAKPPSYCLQKHSPLDDDDGDENDFVKEKDPNVGRRELRVYLLKSNKRAKNSLRYDEDGVVRFGHQRALVAGQSKRRKQPYKSKMDRKRTRRTKIRKIIGRDDESDEDDAYKGKKPNLGNKESNGVRTNKNKRKNELRKPKQSKKRTKKKRYSNKQKRKHSKRGNNKMREGYYEDNSAVESDDMISGIISKQTPQCLPETLQKYEKIMMRRGDPYSRPRFREIIQVHNYNHL